MFDPNNPFADLGSEEYPDYITDDEYLEQLDALGIIASDLGREINEVLVNLDQVDPSVTRATRFETLNEAVQYLIEIGVIQFGRVVMIENMYTVAVPDCTDLSDPACFESWELYYNNR